MWNDYSRALPHPRAMARKRSTPATQRGHRWFLAEWATEAGLKQADAQRDLGWPKSTASDLWNGKQRYTQDHVDEVTSWLKIEPFELLMHPDEAKALRAFRQAARTIAAEDPRPSRSAKPGGLKTTRATGAN